MNVFKKNSLAHSESKHMKIADLTEYMKASENSVYEFVLNEVTHLE